MTVTLLVTIQYNDNNGYHDHDDGDDEVYKQF